MAKGEPVDLAQLGQKTVVTCPSIGHEQTPGVRTLDHAGWQDAGEAPVFKVGNNLPSIKCIKFEDGTTFQHDLPFMVT